MTPSLFEPADMPPAGGRVPVPLIAQRLHVGDGATDVLHNVTFTVQQEERVVVVGPSRAGKSTLAAVVSGHATPRSGRLRVAGVGVADVPRGRLPALVTAHLPRGPLRDSLGADVPDAADDDLRHALDTVGAGGWLAQLPDGLDTVVGTGRGLSTVRAAQVALARVLLLEPPLVVLDIAADAIDLEFLEPTVDIALEGRPALVMTRRMEQVARADRVLLMDHGRIVERGTREQLLAAGGHFAHLWRAWSARLRGRPAGAPRP
ncbi:ABC transporter ATP-binding protein [Tsukamurella soli]|uniref:ABC transporter domain-containing protein n=1 Tax=Tsukamurella soli TaxID=644556 RepID=A0ABP8JAE9_9ACTN